MKGLKSLALAGRWLSTRFTPHALILGYHRVAVAAEDPYTICVSPENFKAHLKVLREMANPISLQALLRSREGETLPQRSVIVTFDDGYQDIYTNAVPLLEQYAIPATIFITTGYLGREFWWDKLQRLVYGDALPEKLTRYVPENQDRYHCLVTLYEHLRLLPFTERAKLLDVDDDPVIRALTSDELVALNHSELIEVGAHSVTHPLLMQLPMSEQCEEITQSKQSLETLLREPIVGFSYPNGAVTPALERLVRDAGYEYACASLNAPFQQGNHPYRLPRFWPPNWNETQFRRWLSRWL